MQDQPLDLIGTPAFAPGRQRSQLTIADRHGRDRRVVLETAHLIEAPNWSPDGQWLLFNSEGALFRVRADGSAAPARIDTGTHAAANNDHVLSPDGRTVYFSTNDCRLLAVPFEGGVPRRVSSEALVETGFHYYLHGVSPDDGLLAYVGLRAAADGVGYAYGLCTVPTQGGEDRALLLPGVPVDGPEYSPDGAWIYFNGEIGARTPGQPGRRAADPRRACQLVPAPVTGWSLEALPELPARHARASGEPRGHPPHRARRGWAGDRPRAPAGQGTLNVNGWAPDSEGFAYVAYPAVAG